MDRSRRKPWATLRTGSLIAAAWVAFAACGGGTETAPPAPTQVAAPDDDSGIDEAELPGATPIEPTLIEAKTYEGSGELVHPDVAFFPRQWHSRRYWHSATPYPGGDSRFENPSIYSGTFSGEMLVPEGATNPLAKPEAKTYLSDADLSYDPDRGELRMYYRMTWIDMDQVYLTRSANGAQWSTPQLLASEARYSMISPAIVREPAGTWRMWTVNARQKGCYSTTSEIALEQRRSADGLTWGSARSVLLDIPGQVPWHWDVQWIGAKREYWALVAAYPSGTTCSRTAVYFARSADGTTWSVSPTPLLAAGVFEPLRDVVYRSTFHYHEGSDAITVWFSGAKLQESRFKYAVARARYPYRELLRIVGGGQMATLERGLSPRPNAELDAARRAFARDFP